MSGRARGCLDIGDELTMDPVLQYFPSFGDDPGEHVDAAEPQAPPHEQVPIPVRPYGSDESPPSSPPRRSSDPLPLSSTPTKTVDSVANPIAKSGSNAIADRTEVTNDPVLKVSQRG